MINCAIKKVFVITILILLCFTITIANRQRDRLIKINSDLKVYRVDEIFFSEYDESIISYKNIDTQPRQSNYLTKKALYRHLYNYKWDFGKELSLMSLSNSFSDNTESSNLQNANYTVQKNIITIFQSKPMPFLSISSPANTLKIKSDLREESNDIRKKKTISVSVNLAAGTAVIAAMNAGLNVSSKIDITISYFHLSAILAYKGKGISLGSKFYLPPQTNFTTYISIGVGPVWRLEENKDASLGLLTITQFGWDYTSDYGINVFGAVGPIFSFVPDEKINGALLLLGLGLRF